MQTNLSADELSARVPLGLVPAAGVTLYDLNSQRFTDYALKQRLLKLPDAQVREIVAGMTMPTPWRRFAGLSEVLGAGLTWGRWSAAPVLARVARAAA